MCGLIRVMSRGTRWVRSGGFTWRMRMDGGVKGIDRPRVRQAPEGSGEQGKMEETGCEIICGAATTLAVKGLMMMMLRVGV